MNGSHQLRRKQFYQNLNAGEAVVLFAGAAPRKTADASYPFFTNRNFYYLTGILQIDSIFFAINQGGRVEETLFIHDKNPMAERWHGYRISHQEAIEASGIKNISEIKKFDEFLKDILEARSISSLWYDFDKFDEGRKDAPQNKHSESLLSAYSWLNCKNAYPLICEARTIKDAGEIAEIRNALGVTRDGIHAMMKAVKSGMYEYQLEGVFNKVLADAGVREPAFANIVSSGRNNFFIHYEEPMGIINDGDLILTDVGARKNQYVSDISRAFPVNGKFTPEQKEIYSIALKVNKELMSLLVPGEISFEQIEAYARRRISEELVAAGHLGKDEDVSKYYWHKGTHHIGLDVHDVGPHGNPIAPGMVFTIDVGIYMEDKNIGFRIEDNVLITETGYEHLSADIVREIDDIEAMMCS
ncbi:MAG: aminopeptidase P N-terminal domain-containing protein [Akkermansiaceae bacterium]|jgi:Xaa-Pro aminopeptidase